ncbi:hypothetical protein ATO6_02015 [Oceanicola sp. 22II-s10i]|nr:hypothetical protein ATO6_02015 [Oceanicola sp. 22II-s10i]
MDAASWRALLYVPAHVDRFVTKAAATSADAIILDLEDAVPSDRKDEARTRLADAIPSLKAVEKDVLVRVNPGLARVADDVTAAIRAGADAIMLPKADGASQLRLVDELMAEVEVECGRSGVTLVLLIETLEGLDRVDAILNASHRIVAAALGAEDISARIMAQPTEEALLWPRQQVVYACARAGVVPLGLLGSMASVSEAAQMRDMAARARGFGLWGATCIHPDQVDPLRAGFMPDRSELMRADRMVRAFETAQAEGRGSVMVDGQMVDLPVAERARAIIARTDMDLGDFR